MSAMNPAKTCPGVKWYVRLQILLLTAMLLAPVTSVRAYHFPWDQGHDTTDPNYPDRPGPNDSPQCDPCKPGSLRSPAYASTGHAFWAETDLVLRGRTALAVGRSYNSNDPITGLFGNGWSSGLDTSFAPATRGTTALRVLKTGDGKRYEYVRGSGGTYTAPSGHYGSTTETTSEVTLTALSGARRVFALDGRLTDTYDANGNHVHLTHDASGRPSKMADDNGRSLSFSYNGSGQISLVTDHTNRQWKYDYDADGNLVTVTNPLGGQRQYSYQSYQPAGDSQIYFLLTKVVDESGVEAVAYTYTNGKVTTYTSGQDKYTYTRPAANTATGGTVSKRDSAGVTTSYTYGPLGLVTSDTDASGNKWSYTLDSSGNLTQVIDAAGQSWLAEYDALGRQTKQINPLGQSTSYEYTGSSPRPTKLTSPSGRVVTLAYDAKGNLTQTTDPAGAVTALSYTAQGNVSGVTNALNQTTQITHSAYGLPLQVTDALGRLSTLAYDNLGRVSTATNAAGEATSYTYDDLDRVTAVKDPMGHLTGFAYDATGRLTQVTDAKGSVTKYEYDTYGRRSAEVAPDGRRTTYTYNSRNLLTKLTWPDNTTISYTYDNARRLTQQAITGEVINYTYDALNRLTAATGAGGNVAYTYDAAGRVLTETSGGKTNTITRNAEGERIKLDYLGQSNTYTRDIRGLVTQIASPAGNFGFSFDVLGRRTQLSYPNGSTASYAFDAAGQLTNLTHAGVFNAPYAHTFDAAGRITRITGDGPDWNYSYDTLGRLTRATQGSDAYTYTLDEVGNILDGGRTHDANHRLTADANKTYSYDQRGNLTLEQDRTTGARTVYTWNVKNQLKQVQFFSNATAASLTQTLAYTYDSLGRRASKTDNGSVQRFVYDGDDLVGTLNASNAVTASNVFSGAIDEPLASTSGGLTKTLYANHLGSVMAAADGGSLTNSYRYSPYGQTLASSSADSTPFRYTAREKDTDNLYYYRARYYNPSIQRFLAADPIGLRGGSNTFRYVYANPVGFSDPFGLYGWNDFTSDVYGAANWAYQGATSWHFEGRAAANSGLPNYSDAIQPGSGWRLLSPAESIYHDNGVGLPELKFINSDGREVVFDGCTHDIVTDPRFLGTYNYVVPGPIPSSAWDIGGWTNWAARGAGHLAADVLPYWIGGNVRGGY